MISNTRPAPIVRVQGVRNRTQTGKRTSKPAQKAAIYFAFGREARTQATQTQEHQRGQWLGPGGELYSHEAAFIWSQEEAINHEYTFQALLSVPQGRLTPQDYGEALDQAGILQDWRLIVHNDTSYSHAHVLFFRDKRIEKEQYLRWQADVRQALATSEQQRLSEPEAVQSLSEELTVAMPEIELA